MVFRLRILQIHDNAGLLELPSEREAHVRRAGGESRSDTVGDGQPGVRGLRAAAAGHAAHQPGIVRRKRSGQFRRMISRPMNPHPVVGRFMCCTVVGARALLPHGSGGPQFPLARDESRISISHNFYGYYIIICIIV